MTSPSTQAVYDAFERQFSADGEGFVYRKRCKGAGYRLTASERDQFLRDFASSFRQAHWWLMGILCAGAAALVSLSVYFDDVDGWFLQVGFCAIMAVGLIVYFAIYRKAFAAPSVSLSASRAMIAPPLSPDEARRNALSRLSYGNLAGAVATSFLVVLLPRSHTDVWHGWGRLYWLFPALMAPLGLVQAYRKWKAERR